MKRYFHKVDRVFDALIGEVFGMFSCVNCLPKDTVQVEVSNEIFEKELLEIK